MNCPQTRPLLASYIDGEITALERDAIGKHLEVCAACREEMEILSGLETRVTRHLHMKAASVSPSSQAWNAVQAELTSHQSPGVFVQLKDFFFHRHQREQINLGVILALIVILIMLLASPPAWALAARIGGWVETWFHFQTPGRESSMSIGGFEAFVPYSPAYVPAGFDSSGIGGSSAPDFDSLELTYSKGSQFVTILQSKGAHLNDLPQGKKIIINSNPGAFVETFATSAHQLQQKIPHIPVDTSYNYINTSLMVWNINDIRIELVSNLPEDEMLKIAQSLALIQESGENQMAE